MKPSLKSAPDQALSYSHARTAQTRQAGSRALCWALVTVAWGLVVGTVAMFLASETPEARPVIRLATILRRWMSDGLSLRAAATLVVVIAYVSACTFAWLARRLTPANGRVRTALLRKLAFGVYGVFTLLAVFVVLVWRPSPM